MECPPPARWTCARARVARPGTLICPRTARGRSGSWPSGFVPLDRQPAADPLALSQRPGGPP
eukprot:12479173-Alexandrium_andersonii.AAC.1